MNIKKAAAILITSFLFSQVAICSANQEIAPFLADEVAIIIEDKKIEDEFLEGYIQLVEESISNEEPEIFLETDFSPKYRVNEIKQVSTYSKSIDEPSNSDFHFGKGNFKVGSASTQYNDNNTLVKKVKSEFGATYQLKRFSISGGFETVYDTTSINEASRGAFLTPKLKLTDRATISLKNKINQDATKYEPTLGLDYTPKFIKNSSIWLGAGATFKDNLYQSQTLNLKTNFYLF